MNLLINFSCDRSKKLKDVGLRTLIEKRIKLYSTVVLIVNEGKHYEMI